MIRPGDRSIRWLLAMAGSGALLFATACHDPDAPPTPTPPIGVSDFVLEHMGQGGAVRRVIYTPPPDLALPRPEEMELPFPGPEVDDDQIPDPAPEDDDEPGEDADPDSDPAPGSA